MTGPGLPAATAPTTGSASTALQPGLTVGGQGGSTTLPEASAADFDTSPTPLDKPDATYPSLTMSHVAVLQAIGTPAAVIQGLAVQQPQAEYLDRYIQGEVMQNPEGWDDYVGNPHGTARAGLQQLMPNVQLPAPGGGTPGYMADGSPVSGINVPGLSTPLLNPTTGAPQAGGGEGLVKGLVVAAAVVGVGLIGWKVFKGKKPEGLAAGEAFANILDKPALGVVGASGVVAGGGPLSGLSKRFVGSGVDGNNLDMVLRGATLDVLGSHAGGGLAATSSAATAYGVLHGLAPGEGYVQSISAAAKFAGIGETMAHRMSMDSRWMGVLETSARNGGTLGDMAAAGIVASQAIKGGGAANGASPAHLAGLQQMFQGAANALV